MDHGTAVHLCNNAHVHVLYVCTITCIVVTARSFSLFFLQQQKPATIVFIAYRLYKINTNVPTVLHSGTFIVTVMKMHVNTTRDYYSSNQI